MSHLMWLFIIPFLASFFLFVVPIASRKILQYLAFLFSLLPLALLVLSHDQWLEQRVIYNWLPFLGIQFHLKVDALSLVFLYLTAIVVPISVLAAKEHHFPHMLYGLILLTEGLLIGFFTARDLALFTIFWESMLIPLYFMINIWGGHKRQTAALKFLIYLIAGSTLMVVAVLALYVAAAANTFSFDALAPISETLPHAMWLAAIFLLAFAVKTPLFPFHAWLPDAYCQASTSGSILLSGLLSKAGIYGFLRVGMELFPTFMQAWSPWFLGLAIIGVFYGGFAAWVQNDFKRVIAYSSFAHVNFILVGIFTWNQVSHTGAIIQAFNHGITITALFLVAGWLQERLGSTAMGPFKGVAKYWPHLCWLTLFFVLSSVALPGMNNFVGELLILFGLFKQQPIAAAFLALTVILSVMYMLRWMQKVYFEEPTSVHGDAPDIKATEWLIALPLMILILWVGIYPAPLLKIIEPIAHENIAALEEPS